MPTSPPSEDLLNQLETYVFSGLERGARIRLVNRRLPAHHECGTSSIARRVEWLPHRGAAP
jgi:hypothetical protein